MRTSSVLTILSMALVTYATRVGGLWLMGCVRSSPRIERWLHHIPGAVLISIVAPIAVNDPAELMAVLAAAVVGVRTGNVLLTMLIGIGVVWTLRYLI